MSDDNRKSYQNQDLYENGSEASSTVGISNMQDVSNGAGGNVGPFKDFIAKNFPTTKNKIPLTFIYCLVFWNFGICVAIFGPTLLDLACQTSSNLSAMSLLYFIQNLSSLIGCFVSGIVIKNNRLKLNDFLLICTVLMPFCVSLMPFAKHIFLLGLVMAFLGFNMGCIDNIANLAILKLHSTNVSAFMQTMHFFYGVGAFLTPIIVKSFLNSNFNIHVSSSSFNCYNTEDLQEYIRQHHVTSAASMAIVNQTQLSEEEELSAILMAKTLFTSKTKYAFWILALIQLPAPFIIFMSKMTNPQANEEVINNASSNDPESYESIGEDNNKFQFSISYFKSMFSSAAVFQMVILVSIMVFLFEGLQASHGGFIFSYAVEKYDIKQTHKLSHVLKNNTKDKLILNRHHEHHHSNDAYLTATFWAFFSIGRLASIFIATKFSSSFMLIVDIIGCFVSTIFMLLSSFMGSINLLYLATSMLGLFLSNTTPTSYTLAELNIGMTPTLTSFVIICAASGEMVLPLIVANLFERIGPTSFLFCEFIITILSAFVFLKFFFYSKQHGKCCDSRDSLIWLTNRIETNSEGAITGINLNLFNGEDKTSGKPDKSTLVGKSSIKYYAKMEEDSD